MQYLVYGGAHLLTSDAAAAATLSHCVALAQRRTADVVRVPVVDLAGSPASATMVLGSAIPLMSVSAPDDALESDDVAFVADLERRTAAVRHSD